MNTLIFKHLLAWWKEQLLKEMRAHTDRVRAWQKRNPKKTSDIGKRHYQKNRRKSIDKSIQWSKQNLEKKRKHRMESYYRHRDENIRKMGAWAKEERKRNPQFRLRDNLYNRVWQMLRGKVKSAKTMELIGTTLDGLRHHLERHFQSGMTWENYGQWHVDHIKPCASFDLTQSEQQRTCFHYSNLQPLWAADNIRKGDKCLI